MTSVVKEALATTQSNLASVPILSVWERWIHTQNTIESIAPQHNIKLSLCLKTLDLSKMMSYANY